MVPAASRTDADAPNLQLDSGSRAAAKTPAERLGQAFIELELLAELGSALQVLQELLVARRTRE